MVILVGRIYDDPNWKVASDDEIVNNFFDHFMSKIRAIDHRFGRSGMKFDVSIVDDTKDSIYIFRFRITEKYMTNIYYSKRNKEWTVGIAEFGDVTMSEHFVCSFPRMEAVVQKLVEYILWY